MLIMMRLESLHQSTQKLLHKKQVYASATATFCSVQSYYDTLEISPGASPAQIKAAYFRLSKKYHPDTSKGKGSTDKFLKIEEAYKTLSNTRQRQDYDNTQSSDFRSESPVDEEYRKFAQRQASPFKSRRNTGSYPTGKTAHFDFDEFHKKHYGESVRASYNAKINKQNFDKEMKNEMNVQKVNYIIFGLFIATVTFIMSRTLK